MQTIISIQFSKTDVYPFVDIINVFLSNTLYYQTIILKSIFFIHAIRVFANGLGDQGSIPGQVIPKTLKMVRDTSLLNTQHYKIRIKGKMEQSRERSSALPYTSV